MQYLVNCDTKEHQIMAGGVFPAGLTGKWQIVDADGEGWIEWGGKKKRPPLPDDAKVEVKFGYDDEPNGSYTAKGWSWNDSCLTHYRPIFPAESKPTLEETWDEIKKDSNGNVFVRLAAAVAASEQIPALIAEINAMLHPRFEVRENVQGAWMTQDEKDWDDQQRKIVDGAMAAAVRSIMAAAPAEQPADDMTDWRNWREGDIVQCISQPSEHGPRWFTVGDLYAIYSTNEVRPLMMCNRQIALSNNPVDFKFHSRPVAK